jgi:hypothetical protein
MPGKALTRQSLAATAHWAAAVRAMESAREDPLFSDSWAAALAGPEGTAWIQRRSPESVIPMVLRTRFFDDYLLRIAVSAPYCECGRPRVTTQEVEDCFDSGPFLLAPNPAS